MVGALTEDHLRCLLIESGEMRRWKEAEQATPEGFEISIPLPLWMSMLSDAWPNLPLALNSSMMLPP
jgi:hypothetical protein